MNRNAIYIFIFICLFFNYANTYAQTLNPDTLVKYHVSKILTYKLDSTGQKVLTKTTVINEHGLLAEYYTNEREDSVVPSVHVDTFKYIYDLNNRIIRESHSSKITSYINGIEKISTGSWTNETAYKNPFFVNPFSKKSISYITNKKDHKTTRRYVKGKLNGYFEYSTDHTYSFEKYYYSHYKRRHTKNNAPYQWKKYRYFSRKRIIQTRSTFNSNSYVAQKNIDLKNYYYTTFFKKPVLYSYIKTYQYIYQGPFIATCKTQYPYFVYTSKEIRDTKSKDIYKGHKKIIRCVEERGMVTEEEFYEYITH